MKIIFPTTNVTTRTFSYVAFTLKYLKRIVISFDMERLTGDNSMESVMFENLFTDYDNTISTANYSR
ncbi:hypothetical protein QQG55_46905 [Brugia pahangi]